MMNNKEIENLFIQFVKNNELNSNISIIKSDEIYKTLASLTEEEFFPFALEQMTKSPAHLFFLMMILSKIAETNPVPMKWRGNIPAMAYYWLAFLIKWNRETPRAWEINGSESLCGEHIITNDSAIKDNWSNHQSVTITPLYK